MTAPRFLLLPTVLLVAIATFDVVQAAKLICSDAKFIAEYQAVQSKMSACQATTGIALELPLAAKKKTTLCEQCTELATVANVRGFPKCNVLVNGESITLNQQFVRLFRPCVSDATASPSSSADGDDDTSAATKTPKPAATKTPKPDKSASSPSSGSADSTTAVTPKPSKTPKPPKTPKASKSPKTSNASTAASQIDDDVDNDGIVDTAVVDSSSSAAASSFGTNNLESGDSITSSSTNGTSSTVTSAAGTNECV